MITIDRNNLCSYTSLGKDICIKILEIIEREFGEIGDFCIEENEVGFRVYKGPFEIAPAKIIDTKITLTLFEKFENSFSLGYHISIEA